MLTDTEIRKTKPAEKIKRLYDSQGLYLEITPSGGRYWRMKYRFDGKEARLAFGVYPAVTLARARAETLRAREQLANGQNPSEIRKAEKLSDEGVNSVEQIAREWIAKFSETWSPSHTHKVTRRLELHAFPAIGRKPIADVQPHDVLTLMQRAEERGEMETAHGIRVVVGQVCRYAVATRRATNDPTPALKGAIKANINKNMAALTDPKAVGGLVSSINEYAGSLIVRTALLLSALTFQRPGNIRAMEWSEIDFDKSMWTIPSAKMKRTKESKEKDPPHLVPLATQALEALRKLHAHAGHSKYVFPGERSHDRCISENTVAVALRTMGYTREQMVAHGFRAMARTLLDEQFEEPIHFIESQLAHKVRDTLGTSYNRTSHIEQRRGMMQRWSDYLDKLAAGGEVVAFAPKAA
jgi:integrase